MSQRARPPKPPTNSDYLVETRRWASPRMIVLAPADSWTLRGTRGSTGSSIPSSLTSSQESLLFGNADSGVNTSGESSPPLSETEMVPEPLPVRTTDHFVPEPIGGELGPATTEQVTVAAADIMLAADAMDAEDNFVEEDTVVVEEVSIPTVEQVRSALETIVAILESVPLPMGTTDDWEASEECMFGGLDLLTIQQAAVADAARATEAQEATVDPGRHWHVVQDLHHLVGTNAFVPGQKLQLQQSAVLESSAPSLTQELPPNMQQLQNSRSLQLPRHQQQRQAPSQLNNNSAHQGPFIMESPFCLSEQPLMHTGDFTYVPHPMYFPPFSPFPSGMPVQQLQHMQHMHQMQPMQQLQQPQRPANQPPLYARFRRPATPRRPRQQQLQQNQENVRPRQECTGGSERGVRPVRPLQQRPNNNQAAQPNSSANSSRRDNNGESTMTQRSLQQVQPLPAAAAAPAAQAVYPSYAQVADPSLEAQAKRAVVKGNIRKAPPSAENQINRLWAPVADKAYWTCSERPIAVQPRLRPIYTPLSDYEQPVAAAAAAAAPLHVQQAPSPITITYSPAFDREFPPLGSA